MPTEFKLPDLGENITSADVLKILVAAGDAVEAEQPVIEVETDKATIEVPCPHAGTIAAISVSEGDTLNVGDVILTLDGEGGESEKPQKKKAEPAGEEPAPEPEAEPESSEEEPESDAEPEAEAEEEPQKKAPAKQAPPAPRRSSAPAAAKPSAAGASASPSVRKLARELGIDIETVDPGDDGRVNREDVLAAVRGSSSAAAPKAAAPAAPASLPKPKAAAMDAPDGTDGADDFGPVRTAKLPKIRQTIARKMVESSTTIPHVTNFDDADVTELEKIRKSSKEDYEKQGIKLTPLPFVIKAAAQALRNHPVINATVDMENNQVIYKRYVSIGVAVDTERGLIVPVIRNVDQLSIPEIAEEIMNVADKARSGSFDIADLRGGTFTISNLGAIGGQYSTPIINSPEVAILLPGRSRMVAVPTGDGIVPRLMMPLSLSYDHRLVDGGAASRFLNDVKAYLENPGRLLLAP